jgi:peroxiredoxin
LRQLADYASSYHLFKQAGIEVLAISVDPHDRSAAMRHDLRIEFPLLSDLSRETITKWGLLNRHEKGGIAFPATFLIDRGLLVRFSTTEDTSKRVQADQMLEFIKSVQLEAGAAAPGMRRIAPGIMFLRAIVNSFRHGIRVRQG